MYTNKIKEKLMFVSKRMTVDETFTSGFCLNEENCSYNIKAVLNWKMTRKPVNTEKSGNDVKKIYFMALSFDPATKNHNIYQEEFKLCCIYKKKMFILTRWHVI